ncbi:MAG: hypothetical protein HRU27_06825 [Rhizobiaceae bacterium]|nr:hypothetical protein [Rhizobiaceae bacterium]
MAGFWAVLHVVRLVLDLARRAADWARQHKARRRTLQQLRNRAKALLHKAKAARDLHRSGGASGGDQPEQLRDNDGFRRD